MVYALPVAPKRGRNRSGVASEGLVDAAGEAARRLTQLRAQKVAAQCRNSAQPSAIQPQLGSGQTANAIKVTTHGLDLLYLSIESLSVALINQIKAPPSTAKPAQLKSPQPQKLCICSLI